MRFRKGDNRYRENDGRLQENDDRFRGTTIDIYSTGRTTVDSGRTMLDVASATFDTILFLSRIWRSIYIQYRVCRDVTDPALTCLMLSTFMSYSVGCSLQSPTPMPRPLPPKLCIIILVSRITHFMVIVDFQIPGSEFADTCVYLSF